MNENPEIPEVVTPEVTPEEEKVTLSKTEHEDLVKKLADETQAKTNLVEEIKSLREKKQITEAEFEEYKKKIDVAQETPVEPGDLTAERIAEIASRATQEVLNKNTETTVASNKESALIKFKGKYKEFHPENDEGGIKIASLERKLERFNTTGLSSEADFLSVFEDAYNLIGKPGTPVEPGAPIPTDPSSEGNVPASVEASNLTPKELKIIDDTFAGDKEAYLKIKAKRPDYVDKLVQGKHY